MNRLFNPKAAERGQSIVLIALMLVALLAFHLAVAGIGLYLLARELGLLSSAALCGAFAFEFGGITLFLAGYTPSHLSNYVWMPLALFCTERTLRHPTPRASTYLGAVLAVQILAGYPQHGSFTYQLIATIAEDGSCLLFCDHSGLEIDPEIQISSIYCIRVNRGWVIIVWIIIFVP